MYFSLIDTSDIIDQALTYKMENIMTEVEACARHNMRTRRTIIILAVAIMAIAFFSKMFDNNLHVQRYNIYSDKVSKDRPLRIVLLTDLHSYIFGDNQDTLIAMIAAQHPDFIALSGDIADDDEPIDGTELMLQGIAKIAPAYYVLGNHEYWSGEPEKIASLFKSYGVTVLYDELVEFDNGVNRVLIGGITDPTARVVERPAKPHKELLKAFKGVKSDPRFTVLLAHRPERYEQYEQYGFNLAMSGHAHGGQVRIPPFVNGLYAPNQGWFPQRAGGLYSEGGFNHVVSRGLVINPRLPRIFNPPEICVIQVKNK